MLWNKFLIIFIAITLKLLPSANCGKEQIRKTLSKNWLSRFTRQTGSEYPRTQCGPVPVIENGKIGQQGGYSYFGSRRAIICNPGYYLFGNDASAVCGFDYKWHFDSQCKPGNCHLHICFIYFYFLLFLSECNDELNRCTLDRDASESFDPDDNDVIVFLDSPMKIAFIVVTVVLAAAAIIFITLFCYPYCTIAPLCPDMR